MGEGQSKESSTDPNTVGDSTARALDSGAGAYKGAHPEKAVPKTVAELDDDTLGELVAETLDFLTKQSGGAVPTTKKVIESAAVVLAKLGCTGDLYDKQADIERIIEMLVED